MKIIFILLLILVNFHIVIGEKIVDINIGITSSEQSPSLAYTNLAPIELEKYRYFEHIKYFYQSNFDYGYSLTKFLYFQSGIGIQYGHEFLRKFDVFNEFHIKIGEGKEYITDVMYLLKFGLKYKIGITRKFEAFPVIVCILRNVLFQENLSEGEADGKPFKNSTATLFPSFFDFGINFNMDFCYNFKQTEKKKYFILFNFGYSIYKYYNSFECNLGVGKK